MRTANSAPEIKITTEDPELNERFNRVLSDTVEALQADGLKYAFIGGIASGGLGRPRSTHDIDVFVMPEDAERALRALDHHGFRTEKTDPSWLYKGFKEDILVDIIFKSKGEIYLDSEMYQRLITAEFHGRQLRLVAPEDLLIIKAAAHSELTPGHWHDAIALLSHATLDWEYLIKRARRAPRRLLSLLLYAQSSDIFVPNWVVHELFSVVYGDTRGDIPVKKMSTPLPKKNAIALPPLNISPHVETICSAKSKLRAIGSEGVYAVAHLREKLASDPRTTELDIQIEHSGENKILLRGEVTIPERRRVVEELAKELIPDCQIENQIRILKIEESGQTEEVSR